MSNTNGRPKAFELDERHASIPAFDPAKVAHPSNGSWGRREYRRVEAERYISPLHVALERDRLWPFAWQIVGREEELPAAGDYLEYKVGDQSFIVVRTTSGAIKAFVNACQHRGTQLVKGCGHAKQFACPYHGWRWSLEGANLYVHDRTDFPGIDDEDLSLPQCAVDSWGGFIFIRPEQTEVSLADFLRPLAERLGEYKLHEYRIKSWRSVVVPANWKTALEAFEEVYHLMATHPQTMKGNCDVSATYDLYGDHSIMVVPVAIPSARFRGKVSEQQVLQTAVENLLDVNLADEAERLAMEQLKSRPLPDGMTTAQLFQQMSSAQFRSHMPDVDEDRYLQDWNCTIFPNMAFNLFPGNFFGFLARPNGGDPDSCIFDVIALIHPAGQEVPAAARQFIEDPQHDWGVVLAQDFTNLARVQQGMHQRKLTHTRLAAYQESRIANRMDGIDRYYREHAS